MKKPHNFYFLYPLQLIVTLALLPYRVFGTYSFCSPTLCAAMIHWVFMSKLNFEKYGFKQQNKLNNVNKN